jgi:phosphoribosyl 1,2-cyclic phosphodiesterase
MSSDETLRMIFRGTRGSVPVPGPATARFGGNTSCVEVRAPDGSCVVLDAGTGIRGVGQGEALAEADIFLTHLHLDHLQGLPFFAPFYDPAARVCIHAPGPGGRDPSRLLGRVLSPPFFPVPFEQLPARVTVARTGPEPWQRAGVEVAPLRVPHPDGTVGYRVRAGRASIAYLPDCELPAARVGWRRRLLRFLAGVDVLVHDAMYTAAEYAGREGWGHSPMEAVVALAEEAGVARLCCFHHLPERDDDALAELEATLRADALRRGSELQIEMAAEGREIALPAGASAGTSR